MFVRQLQLNQFRNYQQGQVSFCPETNVIYGQNARGKTNLIEAVYMLSTARSHRFAKEKEMILFGSDRAKIVADFHSHNRDHRGELELYTDRKKQIRINGAPLERASLLMGYFNVVLFCPEELRLVKGAPKERRKMLDLGICQLRRKYFHSLIQYSKIVEQKNHLLKTNPNSEMLWVWSEKLAEAGSQLIRFRHSYIENLQKEISNIHFDICKETLTLHYECGVDVTNYEDLEQIQLDMLAQMERNLEREKRMGMALIGPHRDDFTICINGKDAKTYASQGQQRTAVLSLKLAEIRLIEQSVGEKPVLLLDDVLSELDEQRQNYLLNNIHGMQVLITCTHRQQFDRMQGVHQIDVEGVKQPCTSI